MLYTLCSRSKRPVAAEPSASASKPSNTPSAVETSVLAVETTGTPSGSAPLEPLFLFADEEAGPASWAASPILFGSPPDLLAPDKINNNALRRWALLTPEREAEYTAELACTLTPPPSADAVMDAMLVATPSRYTTPVFESVVQRLTPPPCWNCHTPTPPPPDQHVPNNAENAEWAEHMVVAHLVV
ncbi:uncharacterized protein UHOR_13987 [Ustilago hordei]|uniref:Uncharacterized protein n=1 Tax=Ustilago hordei TaxID=120017 RepID=I2FSM4_USTHO|nr:hypothetical protein NDA15_004950 [Ustilago hordei]KAJ1590202.1 hypothetical protein NDA12_005025 [Ustilago hordei]CCF49917.1 uncharacterized protein UHOR_13987 [Ustilago hordei]